MPCDALTYSFLTAELNSLLAGGRIDKITMPDKDSVYFSVRNNGKNYLLRLCCGASPAVYITALPRQSSPVPTAFCSHLRKHILGGVIVSVTKEPDERVIFFNVDFKNELGIKSRKSLVCEIMGKYSNMILTGENGVISDAIRHIPFDEKIRRQILPGLKYTVLPQEKLSPLDFDGIAGLKFSAHPLDVLQKNLKGLAPVSAAEAVFNSENNPQFSADFSGGDLPQKSKEILCGELANLFNLPASPCVAVTEKGLDFFVRRYNSVFGEAKYFDTLCEAMDFYYSQKEYGGGISAKTKNLSAIVKNAKKRAEKRLSEYAVRLKSCEDLLTDKLFGELITANIYKIKSGDNSLTAQDYYSEDCREVVIPLDPLKSPAASAQAYYKKYAKKKRTLDMTDTQRCKTEEEILAYSALLTVIERSETEEELSDICEEMLSLGLIKTAKREKNSRVSKPFAIEEGGFKIFAGRNNVQNDRLIKSAAKNDVWLHVKNAHGSHVVIETLNRPLPDSVLIAAAKICAKQSGLSGKTEVDYTLIRHVSKPAGSAQGRVVYTHQKTIFVDLP